MPAESDPVPIAFCITELDRGGAERALSQLVLGLDRKAWLPRVYCLGPRGYFADALEAQGIAVECFNGRGLISLPRVFILLSLSLRHFRPALLQTFLFHGNLVGRLAGRLARVPKIVSGIRVADHRSSWYGRLDRWTNRLVDHNVCVSHGVADFAKRMTGLAADKMSVIPNGVEVADFANAIALDVTSLGIPRGCPMILTVGRLEEQKGIRYLIQAAASVLREQPDCRFVIVGEGPDRTSLESQASTLGITHSMHFVGSRTDVPALLKAATLFVLPSLWEGMPNSLLEAMAAGRPVIATAVEGSREIVQTGLNGLLVEPADSVALSKAIVALMSDPGTAERLSSQAQQTVSEHFTIRSMVAAYDDLYRKLVQSH